MGDKPLDQPGVGVRPGEDHPVDTGEGTVHRRVLAVDLVSHLPSGFLHANQVQVHVGEQLDLARDGPCRSAAAQDQGGLRRRPLAPEPARERTQRTHDERRGDHHPDDLGGADRSGSQQRAGDPDDRGPNAQRWELIDREMANRAVVAVIEADDLRGEQAHRDAGQRPCARRGIEQDDRRADPTRDEGVGAGQHPPAAAVAPPARSRSTSRDRRGLAVGRCGVRRKAKSPGSVRRSLPLEVSLELLMRLALVLLLVLFQSVLRHPEGQRVNRPPTSLTVAGRQN